jgi:hypothetical protein
LKASVLLYIAQKLLWMVLMMWHILYSGHTMTNDQKVPIVALGDLYYPYTTIHGVYDVVCGAL